MVDDPAGVIVVNGDSTTGVTKGDSLVYTGEFAMMAPSTSFNDCPHLFITPSVVGMYIVLWIRHTYIYYTVLGKVCF